MVAIGLRLPDSEWPGIVVDGIGVGSDSEGTGIGIGQELGLLKLELARTRVAWTRLKPYLYAIDICKEREENSRWELKMATVHKSKRVMKTRWKLFGKL